MCKNENCKSNCIEDILKVISILQQNACGPDTCLDTCDRPMLNCNKTTGCNTRPISLYTCSGNGTPWSMPISKSIVDCDGALKNCCSSVFRVEKVEDNCATFRVLTQNTNANCTSTYQATDSFFTMNLDCIGAIKCFDDTYIDCL